MKSSNKIRSKLLPGILSLVFFGGTSGASATEADQNVQTLPYSARVQIDETPEGRMCSVWYHAQGGWTRGEVQGLPDNFSFDHFSILSLETGAQTFDFGGTIYRLPLDAWRERSVAVRNNTDQWFPLEGLYDPDVLNFMQENERPLQPGSVLSFSNTIPREMRGNIQRPQTNNSSSWGGTAVR